MQGIYTYIPETNYIPKEYKCCSYYAVTIHGAYIVSFSVESIFCQMLYAIHIAPYHFSYFLFCPSPSIFYPCMFHCILGLVTLTVSEWSALSCLVAITFLSLRSTRFPAIPDVYYYYYYYCSFTDRNSLGVLCKNILH